MLSAIALHKKLDEYAVLRSAVQRAAAFKTLDLLTSVCIVNCVVSETNEIWLEFSLNAWILKHQSSLEIQFENLTAADLALCHQCTETHSAIPICLLQCRDALTTRQKLIAQDYKVSYSLAKSCKSDLKKYRCNVENLPRSREARLSYLLMCLESAVHRGKWSSVKRAVTCWDLDIF